MLHHPIRPRAIRKGRGGTKGRAGKGYIAVPACGGSLAEAKRACNQSESKSRELPSPEGEREARKGVYNGGLQPETLADGS
eukprot:1158561-Pelagomonas_calceolata.AAC.11